MTTPTEAPREALPEPLKAVAWITTRTTDGKKMLEEPCITTNPAYVRVHREWDWRPYGVDHDQAQATLESERQAHAAEVERLRRDAERMPAEMATRIQVSFCPGAWDTFIYGVSGHLTMEALTAIDASIRDEDSGSLFDKGTGDYLLSAHYFKGQYGFEGRCEIAPSWELSVISFTPLDAAIDAARAAANQGGAS